MNTETGEIYDAETAAKVRELLRSRGEDPGKIVPMREPPTRAQLDRDPPRIKGYERCPCGSGKLFKNCCKRRGR